MLKISNAILDCQREYFMNHKQLKPMTMQNIADDIGMHVSRVSRAVKGKYIQYPGGTSGMRDIFNNTQTFGDQDSTTEEIKEEARILGADIVMFGHTHRPHLEEEEDLITLNPGSMTYPRQSGRQPSYMVMTLDEEGKASFEIKYL